MPGQWFANKGQILQLLFSMAAIVVAVALKYGAPTVPAWLVPAVGGAGLGMAVLLGLQLLGRVLRARLSQPDLVGATTSLTKDEEQFRNTLIDFVLNSFIDTGNRLIGIFYSLNNIDMGASGDRAFFAMEAVKSGVQVNLVSLENIATKQTSCIDVNNLSLRIVESLRLYRLAQDYLPKFVKITNIDPNRLGSVQTWLAADRQCLADMKRAKIRFVRQMHEKFFASANGFDAASLRALIRPPDLCTVSEKEQEEAERVRPGSPVALELTNVSFDQNGPTEMYITLNIRNTGSPTTIRNWRLSVYEHDKMILANRTPRVISSGKLVPGLSGMLQPENLGDHPLEQGGGRSGRLNFTFPRMFAQDVFGASGLRFRVTAEDISGNQLDSIFTNDLT
jgi:hypothetical protein